MEIANKEMIIIEVNEPEKNFIKVRNENEERKCSLCNKPVDKLGETFACKKCQNVNIILFNN